MLMVPTTCPFCACGCGFLLLARDGNLAGVAPSETHPVSGGKICARGWNAHEAPLWGRRLREPMIRRDGKLQPVSWAATLHYVDSRMREMLDAGKPVGVLGSPRATNEENYLAGRLARAGFETNNVDFCYHSLCRPLMEGLEAVTGESFHNIRLADIDSSDTIVLVEGDLANTHPRVASSVLQALGRGARLIVMGCARTQMARVASQFLQTLPGREGDAINRLLAAIVRTDEKRRESIPWARYDSLPRLLEAANVSDQVRNAAGWIAAAQRAVFLIGPSGGAAQQLRNNAASLATLAAVTGHLGRPGCGLLLLFARSNVRGACDMGVAPDRLPGYERTHNVRSRQLLERLWGKPLPMDRGFDAATMLESVSGLIVLADDPAAVLPMGQKARAALEKMEFVAVLDAFATPPLDAAHAVLPIASFAETEGTVTNMEGRVQRLHATAKPPGEARDGWRVLAELCERFGAGSGWISATDVYHEIAEAAPRYRATATEAFENGWSSAWTEEPRWVRLTLQAHPVEGLQCSEHQFLLARDGAFDWGGDPLVSYSPTLNRDYQSERKLFPNGVVDMSGEDAEALGLRTGWRVKLTSSHGGAVVRMRLRKDLAHGVLLAPYSSRDWLSEVLGEDGVVAVNVERV